MLLTLNASSLRAKLRPAKGAAMRLADVPAYARETLGLYGLNITTDLLAGADGKTLDELRESADKSSCPCLVLIETTPQPMATDDDDVCAAAVERLRKVVRAGHRLGCNAVALSTSGADDPNEFDLAAEHIKDVLAVAERLEINLLITATGRFIDEPDLLTDLIKRVGGFRIGTFPDFETASRAKDPVHHLRRLTPYASALNASAVSFKAGKKGGPPVHDAYDLVKLAEAVESVGYQGTLGIDYRGTGDPEEGVINTRQILETALKLEVS